MVFIETLTRKEISSKIEHISGKEPADKESIMTIILLILWFVCWIIAVAHSISCSKQTKPKLRNVQAGIILSVISWPFYVIFNITGAINSL